MKLKFYTLDAFAEKPFSGNPAAVVPLNLPLPEDTLQKIASEFNLSETAYLSPLASSSENPWKADSRFDLRWFTPTNEVPLCGHATLASAYVLFECFGNINSVLEFETKSGILIAKRRGNFVILDFPENPPKPLTPEQHEEFLPLVNLVCDGLPYKDIYLAPNARKLLVRLHDFCNRTSFESFTPDFQKMLSLHDGSVFKGIILTLKSTGGLGNYYFLSRYFAPWNGINEDPVTGSAHTVLAPYWSEVYNKPSLYCRQCSKRGGDLTVTTHDGRVELMGKAIKMFEGEFNL